LLVKAKTLLPLLAGILIGGAAVFFLVPRGGRARPAAPTTAGPEAPQAKGKILYWRAPMDPTEIYNHPGKSKMGMDLVPVYEGQEAGGAGSIAVSPVVRQNMNLRTAPVERRDLAVAIRSFGKVTYAQDREFSINTKISGWIEKLYVNTAGQPVRAGDPLLEIYSPELVTSQEEYRLALRNAQALAGSPYASLRENAARLVAAARERLKSWDIPDAEIARIERSGELRRTVLLRSKVGGVVTHKSVVQGDKVGPGMDLFKIADLSRVWVEASVYESELPLLRLGQKAELVLDYQPNRTFKGEIDFIYPYLDAKSQANNVRLVFANPDLALKPDMYAKVRILVPSVKDALAVPSEAVLRSGTRDLVFATRGQGEFEPREVKLGVESEDGYFQIVSGLFDGERVVVSGQFLLDSESQTREAIAKMRAASEAPAGEPMPGMGPERETPPAPGREPSPGMTMPTPKPGAAGSPKKKEAGKPKIDLDKLYACPMHPDFLTTDPNSSCPDCGMKVVPAKTLGDKVRLDKAEFYTCSMHPQFLTTDPNGRCPECGMKVVKVKR
jgi:Cu(I)/Ag(I) efflux system membrane fusion protein